MELADQQVADNELSSSVIPSEPAGDAPGSSAPAPERSADKPLSLREQINKSVETIRTEEAKRARDAATGKFTKSPDGAAATPATQQTELQTENKDAPREPASKPFAPPPGFSAETKAFLASLPADHPIKKDIEKREGEVSNGFKSYSDKSKQYDAISEVLAPVRAVYQQQGAASDAEAIRNLITWERAFANPQTRQQAFQGLARQYGIDPSTLVPSSSIQQPSAAQDVPEPLRPVIDQFGNIVQQVQNVESRLQTWEQQQTERELAAFAKDKPHFVDVRELMGKLMMAGAARDLDSAYQQAIKIHPEVSAKIQAEAEAKKAEELAKANAEKARKAALAAVSPATGRPPSGGSTPPNKRASIRESIQSAVTQLREEQRA